MLNNDIINDFAIIKTKIIFYMTGKIYEMDSFHLKFG